MQPCVVCLQSNVSRSNENMGQLFLPRLMFWSVQTFFTFNWPRWRCQSSSASFPIRGCTKLVATALCFFIKFILYKLPLRDAIAMASLSRAFIKHLFRLNYIFKLFNTSLLTDSKLACNVDMWSTFLYEFGSFYLSRLFPQQWILFRWLQ